MSMDQSTRRGGGYAARNIRSYITSLSGNPPLSISSTGCLKKYRLMTGNRNEKIRYHYSPSGQLNLSIFNLDPHTLHLKIGHQTLEIQACKVKIYSAPETRGFVKGPSHDLLSQACCTGISTLTFSFLH